MSKLSSLTTSQLRLAADIKDKISALESELEAVLNSTTATAVKPVAKQSKKGKMSAAGRAKVAAAQKARWAKVAAAKAVKLSVAKPAKKKISAEGIAKIKAAQKARWAKIRAAGKPTL